MIEQKTKFDPALQGVADKILHDLPEEVAATATFKMHEGGDALVLTFPRGSDVALINNVVRSYGGAYVNRSIKGKDDWYFLIPKPKPQAKPPNEETKPAPTEASKPVDAKTAEPQKPAPPQEQPNLPEQFKQPSPIGIYRGKYCSTCEDQGTCRLPSNIGQMQLCVRILEVQFLDGIAERLFKLGQILEGLPKQLPQPIPLEQPKPSVLPSQPPMVQRDTNPREGFEEDGLVWVKVFDGANVKFLKAYEKDNQGRQRFKDLQDWIAKKGDKPFAKQSFLGVECQVFLWNFNQGPVAIGKSKCKSKEHT